jgi:23S rRNA pseudouridine1911/1915/1917 synthase
VSEADVSVHDMPEDASLEVTLALDDHLQRLDRVFASHASGISRSYGKQLIERGCVSLDGAVVTKASAKARAGQRLCARIEPTEAAMAFTPQELPIDTVYLDDHIRVINKPVGLVVHPGAGNWSGTLLNGLLWLDRQARLLPRAGIVHRLDKDTSGLMVLARSRAAMDTLVARIAAREVSRGYIALASGKWLREGVHTIDAAVGRDPSQRTRMACWPPDRAPETAKSAQTDVALLESGQSALGHASWLACRLHSGRTHQIRVHLTSMRHPLLGDPLYGGPSVDGLRGQALHACRLALDHPITDKPLAWVADAPPEFVAAAAAFGIRYNPQQIRDPQ